MKLDYDAVLTTPKGEPVKEGETGAEYTLGQHLYSALLAHEQDLTPDKKLKFARLAQKVIKKEDVTLDEAATMKERALKYAATGWIIAVEDLFESAAKPAE